MLRSLLQNLLIPQLSVMLHYNTPRTHGHNVGFAPSLANLQTVRVCQTSRSSTRVTYMPSGRAFASLNCGDALWWVSASSVDVWVHFEFIGREPAPVDNYRRIRLGDVGYVREGRFHLLFSAGIPLGTRELGVDVPHTFECLDVGRIIHGEIRPPGYLRTSTVRQIGADVGASAVVPWYDFPSDW